MAVDHSERVEVFLAIFFGAKTLQNNGGQETAAKETVAVENSGE